MTDSVSQGSAEAFWSYAREDDQNDGGRITSLAAKLRAEYSILTGSTLEMFLDRESLEWGDAWRQRIDEAITGTVFFIPIITPRYFTREACRRELLQFVAQARRLGLEQLVLPVYYVNVPELEGDADPGDEAMAVIKVFQWEDLRQVRLLDSDSAAYRAAVNRLAESIARRVAEITARASMAASVVDERAEATDDEDESPGVLELLAEMESGFPRAAAKLTDVSNATEELTALAEEAAEEMQKADAQGKGFAGRLRATERFAARLREPAERFKELGASYAADMFAIDAGMLALLDQLKEEGKVGDGVEDFLATLEEAGRSSRSYVDSLRETLRTSRSIAKMSRSLRKPVGDIETGVRNVVDGQQMVEEWVRRGRDLGVDAANM